MVKIEALIRPQRLEEVEAALRELSVGGMTVTEVRGMGHQRGVTHTYRGSTYTVNLVPKLKLEIVVPKERAEEVVDAIVEAARTGEVGDGKVFVVPVDAAVRIRTGEKGPSAL
ncbi:MAG: P-II family nitrogen regulator [Armatimonadetes bacterium]|jgi:nitrogen regulatory protein P-II 1|nr:P-II family nitrogen regulator [Armatimonadota bacterium]